MKGSIAGLMQQAQKMQQDMQKAQEELAQMEVTGQAGGGMVKAVMNGRHELVELKIDPKAVDPTDIQLLEDLIRAAVNQAASGVAAGVQNQLGSMAQGLGIDLSAFMPGGGGQPSDT